MKKSVRGICLIFAILSLLAGCRSTPEPTESVCRVVTQISITYDNGPMHIRREYSSTEKMRAILHYLRWIDPYGTPSEDPEMAQGSTFRIVVLCANGSEKIYLQKADRFMQVDGAPWKTIDPERAITLSQMVGEMESDEQL